MAAGCTASCTNDIAQWISKVESACAGQTMRYEGQLISPATLPLMYKHQYDLACLPGGDSGWCWVDSLKWVGSDIRKYPANLCETGHNTWDADICFEAGFDQMAIQPGDVRLANLYEKSLVSQLSKYDSTV